MKNNLITVLFLVISLSLTGCAGSQVKRQEAKESASKYAALYEELGTAYTKAGMFDEAMAAYKESLIYGPNNAKIHYYLGLLYQKNMHDPQKAAYHFKKYLYLNPDAKDKREVRYL
ncbi:MAG: tetratricopeptide repeat protein, partial [Candidatus Omnitrophica bacterium]|nr:tetratricopeptide repeat protein [Candidatus Omnitrophota bacterium]